MALAALVLVFRRAARNHAAQASGWRGVMDYNNWATSAPATEQLAQSRDPEVIAQLKRMAEALEMQKKAIERMAHKLESVMSPRPPQIAKESTVRQPSAPLACRIAEMCNIAAMHVELINALTDQLEI